MTLEEAKLIVFKEKIEFAKLYKEYGDKTWAEYIKERYNKIPSLGSNDKTQELFISLQTILTPLIGEEKTRKAIQTLKKRGVVSSADHHGILCHPFFLNGSITRGLESNNASSVIAFTCGCISPSNSSYPRGIFFNDNNLNEVRMPFLSLKYRKRSLYGLHAIPKQNIQKQIDKINNLALSKIEKNNLESFLKEIMDHKTLFEQDKLSSQFTIINDILWQHIFKETRGNLVYLEIETLVRDLLLKNHIHNETEINKILFNEEKRIAYIENFEHIIGAHNTQEQKGSHFFWYIDNKRNTRMQLFVNQNELQSVDGAVKIPLTPKGIQTHLESFEILPSMALCYSMISFYYGITLGGGFSQIGYLGDMKKAWDKTFRTTTNIETNIFTGEYVLFTISNGENIKPASLIDLLIYKTSDLDSNIEQKVHATKISDTFDMMMVEFIQIIKGKRESIGDLHKITPIINV